MRGGVEREREKYQYGGEKKLEDCEATYPDLRNISPAKLVEDSSFFGTMG